MNWNRYAARKVWGYYAKAAKPKSGKQLAPARGLAFVLVEVGGGTYHGVREGVTIYRVWPSPGEPGWGASYHSSGRFVAKAKTLKEMHLILEARCNTPNVRVSERADNPEG